MSDTMTLNWISGWIDTELDRVFDNDLVAENVVFREQTREGTSFSTELRLDITSDTYDWTVGAAVRPRREGHRERGAAGHDDRGQRGYRSAALPPTFLNDMFRGVLSAWAAARAGSN